MKQPGPALWSTFLAAIALTCLVWAVFFPVPGYEFVDYDVDGQVVRNPHVRGLAAENLKEMFTSRSLTSYYPVRTLSFAIDYQFWGMNPRGFKLTNVLIHLANTLLVFWLVVRLFRHPAGAHTLSEAFSEGDSPVLALRKPGQSPSNSFPGPQTNCSAWVAALSAGVFAVHPVVVEPVAWVAGREELLMTLGALGCIHFHLSARRRSEAGRGTRGALGYHVGSALCCAAACLSNAVAAVIPLLITAWDLLTLAPPKFRKILYGTSMLWVIGAATIVIKKLGSESELLAGHAGALSAQRLMLMLNVYWLNLKTLVWPSGLAIIYADDPPHSFLHPGVMAGAIAVGLSGLLLWKLRRRKLLLFGLIWFGLALAPSSQIMAHHCIRADRFLYLPLVGLAVAAAMGLRLLGRFFTRPVARVSLTAVVIWGLLLLGILSAAQVRTWQSGLSLWEQCVSVSPESAIAHGGLADNLAKAGQLRRAIPHYRMALRIDPDNKETLNNFALELAAGDDKELRDYDLAIELARRGCELTRWKNRKLRHTLAMALNNLALELESRREFRRAVQCYTEATEADPEYEAPLFNLALLLATCPDARLRRAEEAVRLAERACRIVQYRDANGLRILAAAHAEAGRFDKAAAAIERAIGLAQAAGNDELADRLQAQWKLYRNQHTTQSPR